MRRSLIYGGPMIAWLRARFGRPVPSAPGWYPFLSDSRLHWWDGQAWTSDVMD